MPSDMVHRGKKPAVPVKTERVKPSVSLGGIRARFI
jgi:hypothetical protein